MRHLDNPPTCPPGMANILNSGSFDIASPRPCGLERPVVIDPVSGGRPCPARATTRIGSWFFTADTAPHLRLFPLEDTPSADTPLADKPLADKPLADKPLADRVAVDKAEGRSPGAESSGNFAPEGDRVPVGSTDWRYCRRNTSPSARGAAGLNSSAVAPVHNLMTVERGPGPLGQVVARSTEEPDPGPWCTA